MSVFLVFRGDPIELERGGALSRQSIALEGKSFALNEPRDASELSPKLLAKLRTNSHFEVIEVAALAPSVGVADEASVEAPQSPTKRARRPAED